MNYKRDMWKVAWFYLFVLLYFVALERHYIYVKTHPTLKWSCHLRLYSRRETTIVLSAYIKFFFIVYVHWQEKLNTTSNKSNFNTEYKTVSIYQCACLSSAALMKLLMAYLTPLLLFWFPAGLSLSTVIFLLLFPSIFLLYTSEDQLLRNSLSLTAGEMADGRDGGVEDKLHRWPYVCICLSAWCVFGCVCGCIGKERQEGGRGRQRKNTRLFLLVF